MRDTPPKPAEPTPGHYRHYKDNPYRVIGLALHSETREWLVVYEALYGDGGLFVRPAAMFTETVEVGARAQWTSQVQAYSAREHSPQWARLRSRRKFCGRASGVARTCTTTR